MIMYDNSMYMEAGSYNLVIRDPRIPRKRYVAIFKVQFHPSIHRHADEKEKKKKEEISTSQPFLFPSIELEISNARVPRFGIPDGRSFALVTTLPS